MPRVNTKVNCEPQVIMMCQWRFILVFVCLFVLFFKVPLWWVSFAVGPVVKNTPAKAGDTISTVSTLQLGRSPRVENSKPLSILGFFWKNSKDRRAWQATGHAFAKSQTWLNDWAGSTWWVTIMKKAMHGSGFLWEICTFLSFVVNQKCSENKIF